MYFSFFMYLIRVSAISIKQVAAKENAKPGEEHIKPTSFSGDLHNISSDFCLTQKNTNEERLPSNVNFLQPVRVSIVSGV